MSREEIFFDAITNIREELVEEAQEFVFRKHRTFWRRYAGMAACLVMAVTLLFGVYQLSRIRMGSSGSDSTANDAAPPAVGSGQTGSSGGAQSSEAVSGDSAEYGDAGGDGADHPSGELSPVISFQAVVLEVRTDVLLVEVLSDNDMGQVEIPTGGLENLPEFRAGDVVTVWCAELSVQDGAAVAIDVAAIMLAEPDSP